MFDTHCHLTDPRLLEQLDAVLKNAAAAGVTEMVTIGTHPADWPGVLDLARSHPHIRCALGVHPNYCAQAELSELDALKHLQSHPAVAALGEMGLDYFHNDAPRARQTEFFTAQLRIAEEFGRNVIIHCRQAVDDTLAILAKFPRILAVFHCFTGTMPEAQRIWAAGHLMGFTGVVTFKNAEALRAIAAAAPADRILVETDAPYLTPEPMRKQKTNEPALVVHTAAAVAAARGMTAAELDALTTGNAKRFYKWE